MRYTQLVKNSDEISVLGFGCMRFPQKGNGVDKETTFKLLKQAYDDGINYYDTAFLYHNGKSEVILGEFIKMYDIRKSVYIADKLPGYIITKADQIEKYFNTQIKRLNTSYIDYYLMHMLDSYNAWEKLKSFGIIDFIQDKKNNGEIRHIGFSYHGPHEDFIKIIDDYNWDFCQVQFNYLDEHYQAGINGIKYAKSKNIGVVIMEPLKGGSLADKAPDKVNDLFKKNTKLSTAANSLKWIYNHQEVDVILSGMNRFEHLQDNLECAINSGPNLMTKTELQIIEKAKEIFLDLMKVPCTSCGYCMPCPFNVDIPTTFLEYNNKYYFKSNLQRLMYIQRAAGINGTKSGGDSCTACGKCKKHCPQNIDIPNELKRAHKDLNVPIINWGVRVYKRLLRK